MINDYAPGWGGGGKRFELRRFERGSGTRESVKGASRLQWVVEGGGTYM